MQVLSPGLVFFFLLVVSSHLVWVVVPALFSVPKPRSLQRMTKKKLRVGAFFLDGKVNSVAEKAASERSRALKRRRRKKQNKGGRVRWSLL